jgi:hypothetical protein
VFQSVVRSSESLRPLLVAIIVMIVGLGIGWMTRRRPSPPAELVS